jgi:hypothetical protein
VKKKERELHARTSMHMQAESAGVLYAFLIQWVSESVSMCDYCINTISLSGTVIRGKVEHQYVFECSIIIENMKPQVRIAYSEIPSQRWSRFCATSLSSTRTFVLEEEGPDREKIMICQILTLSDRD